jgi:hypothetical protein
MSPQIDLSEYYYTTDESQFDTAGCDLFILFSPRSFSYLILDSHVPEVISFEKYTFDITTDWLGLLKDISSRKPLLTKSFLQRHFIFRDNIYTLMPFGLFDKDNLDLYLEFNHKLGGNVQPCFDRLKPAESYLIYVAPKAIFDWIYNNFEKFTVRHHNSVLTDYIFTYRNAEESAKTLFIHVWEDNLDVLHIKDGKLIFLNTFTFTSKEEFIYFILFSAKQLKLPIHQLKVELMGEVNPASELFKITSKYIRFVYLNRATESSAQYNGSNHNISLNNFIIHNAFLCE